ncbi:MAG: FtsX-like permease family protein, partial [bacterium]
LAAVQERTREIGLRKALGAKNKHIVEQFLVETMMITFIAGIFGVIIGSLIAYIVANIARSMGYDWDLVITASSIIIGCVVSVGIGLLFGIIPARRASRLDPIEALRYE